MILPSIILFITQNYKSLLIGYCSIAFVSIIAIHIVTKGQIWIDVLQHIKNIKKSSIFYIIILTLFSSLSLILINKFNHYIPNWMWKSIIVVSLVLGTWFLQHGYGQKVNRPRIFKMSSIFFLLIFAYMSEFGRDGLKFNQQIPKESIMETTKQISGIESLVYNLEKFILHDDEAVIKSPDHIKDRITGQLRQVDISLKRNVGLIPILVIIDVMEESVEEDMNWIEQLEQKKLDLRASKAIAVSRHNFSENAKKKAEF